MAGVPTTVGMPLGEVLTEGTLSVTVLLGAPLGFGDIDGLDPIGTSDTGGTMMLGCICCVGAIVMHGGCGLSPTQKKIGVIGGVWAYT